jgi:hypothetical protein
MRNGLILWDEKPTTTEERFRQDHETIYHQHKKNRPKYVTTMSKKGFACVTTRA